LLIIAGPVYAGADGRDEFVEGHREIVERARSYPGCLDLAITCDTVEPGRVDIHEVWESEEQLDTWRAVAPTPPDSTPRILRDEVQKHQVSSSGPPF
jgi:quinol monooxygenase YgiN